MDSDGLERQTEPEARQPRSKACEIPKLPCPQCHEPYSVVKEARGVRRRRECAHCGYRFTTIEVIAAA